MTSLDRVRELNYDHHRRMAEIHAQTVVDGTSHQRGEVDNQSYRALLAYVPVNRHAILELGSASGGQWPLLREWLAPDGRIVGIDLYDPLVQKAREAGLDIVTGYVEKMVFYDGLFDLVCSRHVMEHLGDLDRGISEILRVTRSGGYIAHVTPNMDVDNEPAHLNHLNEAEWREKWRAVGLHILHTKRHPFHGGEVHIVGRKA
jgi:SAM-dependent methyltransferase